jgi:hypothetical protein
MTQLAIGFDRLSVFRSCVLSILGFAAAFCFGTSAHAVVTWEGIEFGGFASQGYLKSSANDYLGKTSDGTFDFREYAVSASWAKGPWRIGAQAFAQKLGEYGNDDIKLDWASVDYQAAQWFGIRAGRVKMPHGLYNEALDLDAVRPFVLLPQSVYDNRLRDFSSAFNGGMIYGNIGLKKAGSVDYKAFYGKMPLSIHSGASDYFNTDAPFPNLGISIKSAFGGMIFWNTPVNGLRLGYSFSEFKDFNTLRFVPFRNANTYKTAPSFDRHLISMEYTWGDWVFATEGGKDCATYNAHYPDKAPYAYLFPKQRYYYLSVSRRINSHVELGAYYSYSRFEQTAVGSPVVTPTLKQGDFALSVRYDVSDHLLFKLEGHFMDGAGKVFDIPSYPQPVANRDNSWTMLAAKATYTF